MKDLRDYQSSAIQSLRQSILSGKKRPVLQLPTGGGKTRVAAEIINLALVKGKRATFVVPALSLIDQTVEAFRNEGIHDVGVIQAQHPLTNPMLPVQICSVQTLARRGMHLTDIVIVDECHRRSEWLLKTMADDMWQHIPFIGLSATPWARGMASHWDDLIVASTTERMIADGWLSPFDVFAPSHPDLSGVKTVAGDYHEGQLSEVMQDSMLIADVVTTWLKHGEGRPTLCFGVDRAHAQALQAQFIQAGVPCGYIDGDTDLETREDVRQAFHSGEYNVVCNVGVLTTGVDWDVRCLILARPTKSEILFTQIIGRALRKAEGKENALILDHSDTHLRLGFVTDIHHERLLNGKSAQGGGARERETPLPKECPQCSFLKPPGTGECPKCGFVSKRQTDIESADGELAKFNGRGKGSTKAGERNYTAEEKLEFYRGLIWIALDRGRKRGWAYHAYRKKFGVNPVWSGNRTEPLKPGPEVVAWARHCDLRFAHSRKERKIA